MLNNCETHDVRYKEITNHDCRGEYTIFGKQPFILVRKELKRPDKLWVGLHEFGHHLLHYPVNHKFSKSVVKRMDREANYFAAIAMMPTWMVESMTFEEIRGEYNYPHRLILIRREIIEAYRI